MNDSELNDLLRRAHLPGRSDAEWQELAEDTVRASLNRGPDKLDGLAPRAHSPARSFVLWSLGVATACVVLGLAISHWPSRNESSRNELADARKLFSELSALFPNQLEGVVFDGSTPRLVLTEKTSENRGTPIFVRLCGAHGCQRVITFSGQRVSLNGETCEVLVDARGHVIVTGEHFAWSSGDGAAAQGGYRIEAAPLTGVL